MVTRDCGSFQVDPAAQKTGCRGEFGPDLRLFRTTVERATDRRSPDSPKLWYLPLTLCQRVYDSVRMTDGKLVARVYGIDMERIQKVVERPDTGGWQDLFREIMAANKHCR